MTNGLSVTKEIAISGSFIRNGKLIVSVESVTWNGVAVQQGFANLGTNWRSANPPITLAYNSQGTVMQNSRVGKALHVVHLQLPLGGHRSQSMERACRRAVYECEDHDECSAWP